MPNTPALKGVVVGYLGHSRYMAESVLPRWVRAATGRAHLDLGERLERAILLFRGTTMAPSAIFAAQQLHTGYDPIPSRSIGERLLGGADA